MKASSSPLLSILVIFAVSLLSLAATLSAALIAHDGARRVALFATSEAWARVEATGLPVVRLVMGGLIIVVDGTGAPQGLARLRAGTPFLIDASLLPGCDPDLPNSRIH